MNELWMSELPIAISIFFTCTQLEHILNRNKFGHAIFALKLSLKRKQKWLIIFSNIPKQIDIRTVWNYQDALINRNLPQIISSVHLVMYGNTLNGPFPTFSESFWPKMELWVTKIDRKSSRILKWNAGVSSFLLVCHIEPEIMKFEGKNSLDLRVKMVNSVIILFIT